MEKLEKDWLTEGLLDLEYKKYLILAYLQTMRSKFDAVQLYPFLADLALHYQNMVALKQNKELIHNNFPKEISKADFKRLKLTYKKVIQDDEVLTIIGEILEFAIPEFQQMIDRGVDTYKFIEEKIRIDSIGISPLYKNEGYIFTQLAQSREIGIYRYSINFFESANEKFRGVHTRLIERVSKSIFYTFEQLKLELIGRFRELPNPATYLIRSDIPVPYNETFMPIAKRLLVRQVNG